MSLLFRHTETRDAGGGSWLDAWGRGDASASDSMSAGLRLGPVYSAVSLIADAFTALPCKAYRARGSGREVLPSQPTIVTDPGVGRVNAVTWRHQAIVSLLLRGNAVGAAVARDSDGFPAKIQWFNPDQVTIDPETGPNPQYFHLGRRIPDDQVVHIPAFTLPGTVWGLSPLTLFRTQIEGGLEAIRHQRRWWRNPQPPAMVKNTAKKLDRAEAQVAKASWMASIQAGEPWFAGADWDYTALTVSQADARFVESIKATATQIAAIYHVAPEDIGGSTGTSLTYSTVELNGIQFGQRAILPWTTRFEAALDRLRPNGQYVKFNLDVLARTDLRGRMDAYETALRAGVLVNSEARALEDRPPLTDEQMTQWQENYRRPAPATRGDGRSDAGN